MSVVKVRKPHISCTARQIIETQVNLTEHSVSSLCNWFKMNYTVCTPWQTRSIKHDIKFYRKCSAMLKVIHKDNLYTGVHQCLKPGIRAYGWMNRSSVKWMNLPKIWTQDFLRQDSTALIISPWNTHTHTHTHFTQDLAGPLFWVLHTSC